MVDGAGRQGAHAIPVRMQVKRQQKQLQPDTLDDDVDNYVCSF